MKTAIRIFPFLFVLFFFGTSASHAGKPFEGIISYKISYPDSKFTESQLAMFPKLLTVTIKGSKARAEIAVGGGSQAEIVDYGDKSKISLINTMGQKYAIKQTADELAKEQEKEPKGTVELNADTKTIAGYTCKKATVTVDEDGTKTVYEVYYTPELGGKEVNFDKGMYKDIDGVMLEFSQITPQQINMTFTATSVEKKSVSAKDFEIPSDYTLTTMEELKNKMGGGE